MKPHDDPMRAAMDFVARVARRPEEYPERFVALPMDPDVIAAILSRERTRLLQFLAREGPTPSVEALAGALKRNYASVSRDVGVLEQAGLVRTELHGKTKWVAATGLPVVVG